jgi:hypothetical protein
MSSLVVMAHLFQCLRYLSAKERRAQWHVESLAARQ